MRPAQSASGIVSIAALSFFLSLAAPPHADAATLGPVLYLNAPDGFGACDFQKGCGTTVLGLPSYDDVYAGQEWSLTQQAQIGSISFFAGIEGPSTVTQVSWKLYSGAPSNSTFLTSGTDSSFSVTAVAPVRGITTEQFTVDLTADNIVLNPGSYTVVFHVNGNCCDTYLDQGLPSVGAFESQNNGLTWSRGFYYTQGHYAYGSAAVEINGVASTPLPSTWPMMLSALAGLGFIVYRRPRDNAMLAA